MIFKNSYKKDTYMEWLGKKHFNKQAMKITNDIWNMETIMDSNRRDAFHQTRRGEYPWALQNNYPLPTDRILDAGGGTSAFTIYLSLLCNNVTVIDPSTESMETLKSLCPKINTVNKDIIHADYPDNYFDKIYCISVLEHTDKPMENMKKLHDLLKINGVMVVTMDVTIKGKDGISYSDVKKMMGDNWSEIEANQTHVFNMKDRSFMVCMIRMRKI